VEGRALSVRSRFASAMADAAVAGWLEEMGLAALIESFEREGVDSEALAALNHAQLKELGVARLGDRAKLMSKVIRRKEIMPAAPAATRTKKKEAAAQSKPSWMQILEERAMVPVGSPPATPDAECADGDAIGGEPERSVQELSPPPPTPRGMAPVVSECSPPPPTPRGVAPTLRMAADKQDGSQAQYNLPRKPQAQGGSPAGPDTTPATVQRTLHAPGATTRAEVHDSHVLLSARVCVYLCVCVCRKQYTSVSHSETACCFESSRWLMPMHSFTRAQDVSRVDELIAAFLAWMRWPCETV